MDMDDDFMGEIEFALSLEQSEIVSRAISLAAKRREDEFALLNPLIMIMQWWEANVHETDHVKGSPEERLTDACRRYISAHEGG